ncbi:uncharacterized protein SPAPADRAFT_51911 [Spathaspora passalidarum NRRL Y-27907]|uniref:F-box domain-containing protein n=1 Tax=Spathaspora passalidarum (strain NRRL Y-27907 / 11-Y1) TaxID=619300 RepID=G3ASL3_SPAPN|nr:uncharacterized protein SPAPADRAFT_51911 [Spathaspora passalidarum NRRL Y-27907]EGW30699.1 hypothetical protein SPAPADRAFT_51911 [Spathaspora passalidarum NRRL Y-27907]
MVTDQGDWISTFLTTYFVCLPDEIVIEILNNVTFDHLVNFFMHFPDYNIQQLTRENYSNEVHFVNRPTVTKSYGRSGYKHRFLEFHGKEAIFRFMDEFPDLVPKRIILFNEFGNFEPIRDIMETYPDRIGQVKEMKISLEKCEITIADFQCLTSFPNLTKLNFLRMDLNLIRSVLVNNSEFAQHPKLDEITFWQHGIYDWSNVWFPRTLKSLDLSWNNMIDISTLSIPGTVRRVCLNYSNLDSFKVLKTKIPDTLTELGLVGNQFETLALNQLPTELRFLDLSSNKISSVVGSNWPKELTELRISGNKLDNEALEYINDIIGWPQSITNLDISLNQFTLLENLSKLPKSLQVLDISKNSLIWNDPQLINFHFPDHLTKLNLSDCEIDSVRYFRFPSSLEKLILKSNEEDIGSW